MQCSFLLKTSTHLVSTKISTLQKNPFHKSCLFKIHCKSAQSMNRLACICIQLFKIVLKVQKFSFAINRLVLVHLCKTLMRFREAEYNTYMSLIFFFDSIDLFTCTGLTLWLVREEKFPPPPLLIFSEFYKNRKSFEFETLSLFIIFIQVNVWKVCSLKTPRNPGY